MHENNQKNFEKYFEYSFLQLQMAQYRYIKNRYIV